MPSELPLKIDLLGKSASELGELAVSLGSRPIAAARFTTRSMPSGDLMCRR